MNKGFLDLDIYVKELFYRDELQMNDVKEGGNVMAIECGNCHKKSTNVIRDKVSNKFVCQVCLKQAIDLGVRFKFDFEEL